MNFTKIPSSNTMARTASGPMETFCAIGMIAFVENLLILLIFASSARLTRSSSLLIGLTINHTLNGIVHVLYYWPSLLPRNQLVTVLHCFNIVVPKLFMALYQIWPVFLAAIGFERLLAVAAPIFYRKHCTYKRRWFLTAMIFLGALISMAINWINAWFFPPPAYLLY